MYTQLVQKALEWGLSCRFSGSKETDPTLRTFLGSQGMKKGDLSKFIEEAVRWRVLHRTAQDIKGAMLKPTQRNSRP
jgi:hypothetical protein